HIRAAGFVEDEPDTVAEDGDLIASVAVIVGYRNLISREAPDGGVDCIVARIVRVPSQVAEEIENEGEVGYAVAVEVALHRVELVTSDPLNTDKPGAAPALEVAAFGRSVDDRIACSVVVVIQRRVRA